MNTDSPSLAKRFLPLILALLILGLAGAGFLALVKSKPQAASKPIQEKIWSVTSIEAQLQPISPRVTLYGRIESPRTAELSAAVTAFVEQLHVDEGARVAAGELLVTLDPRDARLIVAQRQAELRNIEARIQAEKNRYQADLKALEIEQELLAISQRSVKRFTELKGRQVGSDTQLDDARRSYQQQALALTNRQRDIDDHPARLEQLHAQRSQARSQWQSAELELERTRVLAPFDGRISRVQVAPGDRVRSGDPLLTLYNTAALEVRAQIPNRYLKALRASLNTRSPLQAHGLLDGKTLELTLERFAGAVGAGRAGVDALFRINDDRTDLEVGRNLELILSLPPVNNLMAIPPQALYGTDRIYRLKGDRLEAVSIERLGDTLQDGQPRILVRSPEIRPGDRILTTQLPNAITGLKIQLAEG